jgi:hypothetical protein
MPAPESLNMPIVEASKPEQEANSRDIAETSPSPSMERPTIPASQQDQPFTEIMERFIEQDQELGKDLELLEHLKPAVEDTEQPSTKLVEKDRLNEILQLARSEGIPDKLFGYLCELESDFPEEIEVPFVRQHALSDVIRPMWEKRLEHELKVDLLQDLEGHDNIDRLFIPQPQSEIDNPQDLYQLVRKAWNQSRMEELLGMIVENDDAFTGETLEAAVARHTKEVDEYLRSRKEKVAKDGGGTA